MRTLVSALLYLAFTAASLANDGKLVYPSPDLSPEDVVRTQLTALQRNDVPGKNAGIRQVWEFAHPVNRRITGPFENFALMLQGPFYSALINHRSHTIKPLEKSVNSASFLVDVTNEDGLVLRYSWLVERAFGGELNGSWMTVSVSIAEVNGREI